MTESKDSLQTRVPSTQPSAEGLQRMKAEPGSKPVSLHEVNPRTGLQKETMAQFSAGSSSDGAMSEHGQSAPDDSTSSPSLIGDDDRVLRDLEKGEKPEAGEGNPIESPAPPTEGKDPNLVDWNGPTDPDNPMNWPVSKKWTVTIAFAFMTFCVTFASSVFSTATQVTAELYGVSNVVMILGTSLFVLVSPPSLLSPRLPNSPRPKH